MNNLDWSINMRLAGFLCILLFFGIVVLLKFELFFLSCERENGITRMKFSSDSNYIFGKPRELKGGNKSTVHIAVDLFTLYLKKKIFFILIDFFYLMENRIPAEKSQITLLDIS